MPADGLVPGRSSTCASMPITPASSQRPGMQDTLVSRRAVRLWSSRRSSTGPASTIAGRCVRVARGGEEVALAPEGLAIEVGPVDPASWPQSDGSRDTRVSALRTAPVRAAPGHLHACPSPPLRPNVPAWARFPTTVASPSASGAARRFVAVHGLHDWRPGGTPMAPDGPGHWSVDVAGAGPGDEYRSCCAWVATSAVALDPPTR